KHCAAGASGCTGSSTGHVTPSPTTALALCFQLDISPAYCWPFQAFQRQVVIRLPTQVRPTAITVQPYLKKSSALGDISNAPRDFTVSGEDEEGEEETLLGMFSYDIEKEPTQTFPLQNELPRAFRLIRLVIQSNWGKSGYTCIYRVQVHGKIMGIGQA
ncbi:SPAG4 protein, partial [Pelecanoides urinatrix]|nr:SPAG4 protein [Pelecanoides urinatrix]